MRPTISKRFFHLAAIALALTVTACGGGGGGGGATPPVNTGGGAPPPASTPKPGASPTASPTGSPSGAPGTSSPAPGTPAPVKSPSPHPSSTPVSTPMPTPTPVTTPPPATQGLTMLPNTNGRFGLFQVFDWDGFQSHPAMSAQQIESEAPHEDAVWGAFSPAVWNGSHAGMYVSRYMLPVEDDNLVSGHDLSWWQQNHPDWILYACDSNNNPTKQLAWSGTGFNDVPLNFANPNVIQYQIALMLSYLKQNGYNTLAVDNTDLLNYLSGGNPNFGQSQVRGDYGCGTYDASGAFHRVFSGPFDSSSDQAFVSAMVNWVKTVSQAMHQNGIKVLINHPTYNSPTNPNEEQLLSAVDGVVYERGFTDYGKYQSEAAGLMNSALSWGNYTQQHGVAFLLTDYLCSGFNGTAPWNNNAPCNTDPSALPAPQVDWALGTYAIANNGGMDVYISPGAGANYSYRPEYATQYGNPCGAYTEPAANVYERKFANAVVIVNASGASYSLQLNSSQSYRDIENRPVSDPLTVAPADAYVLLTANGCS